MRQSTTSVQDEATSPLAPAAAFQEEDFLEHPRAIALQSQLSILRRTINALQRSQAASEQVSHCGAALITACSSAST